MSRPFAYNHLELDLPSSAGVGQRRWAGKDCEVRQEGEKEVIGSKNGELESALQEAGLGIVSF